VFGTLHARRMAGTPTVPSPPAYAGPMSSHPIPEPGSLAWADLTVPDAEGLRDFYAAVAGWKPAPIPMDGYEDWCMVPEGNEAPVAGICHARGENADLPPAWILYVVVPDLEASLETARARGGEVLHGPKGAGPSGRIAVVRDPAGAVLGLYQDLRS